MAVARREGGEGGREGRGRGRREERTMLVLMRCCRVRSAKGEGTRERMWMGHWKKSQRACRVRWSPSVLLQLIF